MVRDKNLPISGPLIKGKAMEYTKMLGRKVFLEYSRRLDKFKKHHKIKKYSPDYFEGKWNTI